MSALSNRMLQGAAGANRSPMNFISSGYIESSVSTYTFTGVDMGVPGSGRSLLVVINYGSSSTRSVSSVTVGGISATLVQSAGAQLVGQAVYMVAPSVTSGSVVVVLSGAALRCQIAVYEVFHTTSITSRLFDTSISSVPSAYTYTPVYVAGDKLLLTTYTSVSTSIDGASVDVGHINPAINRFLNCCSNNAPDGQVRVLPRGTNRVSTFVLNWS
jgi:hypothetical protein